MLADAGGNEQVLANYLINARPYVAKQRSVGVQLGTARREFRVCARGRGLGVANGTQEGT
jgi:hypothetical protein